LDCTNSIKVHTNWVDFGKLGIRNLISDIYPSGDSLDCQAAAIIPPFCNPAKPDGILLVMQPHSIYIHIPFCQKRCSYCDFNTYAGQGNLIPAYVAAVEKEIQVFASQVATAIPVQTIFFGGGTPSLLSLDQFERIMAIVRSNFNLKTDLEVTLEANPGTLTLDYLTAIRRIGLNRLSVGMQCALPAELALLDRQHSHEDVVQAVQWAREAEFENLSLDLIFGLPSQTLENWADTLRQALDLNPDHFSLYALTIEPDTPLHSWVTAGTVAAPDHDLAAEMYELASEKLATAEFIQYEISNWARTDDESTPSEIQIPHSPFKCHHNLQYWRNLPYIGFGAGAHGFVGGYRTENVRGLQAYIAAVDGSDKFMGNFPRTPATKKLNRIDFETEMRETMMMGLRLTTEGVSDDQFKLRFGKSLGVVFKPEIEKLVDWGLLEWAGDRIRLTSKGRLVGNQVFLEFI